MHRTIGLVSVLVVGTAALALAAPKPPKPKPLPGGMKVVSKLGRPFVEQGKAVSVPLRDDDLADYETISKAELSEDGKSIAITATRCQAKLVDDVTRVPLAKVQARIDATLALTAIAKKKFAEAITRFSSATQKDPETPAYATGLLAAQIAGKKLDAAAQTLSVHGKRNPAWFLWRLAIEPELAAIKDHKRAKDLAAPKPGTATLAKLGDQNVAITDLAPGMAALRTTSTGPTSELEIVSLSSGKLLARIPIVALEDGCDETDQKPCDDAGTARIAERKKVADALLAQLGFEIHPNAFVDVRNGDPVTKEGMTVEFADDAITLSRQGGERALPIDASAWAVAVTPKGVVVKLNRRHLFACDDSSSRFVGAAIGLP